MERVLVTGASSWVGGRAVQLLEARPDTTVLAIGDGEPRLRFASELTLVDLDHLEFADLLLDFAPTTVLHLGTLDRSSTVGAERSDRNIVLGAQALFGAIGRCPATRRVVVKSESAVYSIGPRYPSVATEASSIGGRGDSRHQRRLRDLEVFVATEAERNPEIGYLALRLAPIIGPEVGNDLSRYLTLPVVPTLLGYDPRLQFIFDEDAVGALVEAVDLDLRGVVNVAAPGQLYLSRVLRLGRRVEQPLPKRGWRAARRGLAATGIHLSAADARLLQYGRVMDISLATSAYASPPSLNCRQSVLALYGRLPQKASS